MSSVFTKIIQGQIPSFKIYENDLVLAFLSNRPIQTGHTLIIPKIEVDYFVDVPEPYYSEVFRQAKPIAKAIQKATKCKRIGTMIQGLEVPHFHYHLVPIEKGSDMSFELEKEVSSEDLLNTQKAVYNFLEI